MYKQPTDANASREALKFFEWAYAKGDAMADALDYVPLDSKQKSAVKEIWTAIK